MKSCPNCHKTYDDDANFCPEETCATPDGPSRLVLVEGGGDVGAGSARYEKLARLGGSRTGEVWRARDRQTGVEVAYKVIASAALPNAAALARAERELRQLMRVQSPRIATVLDVGKDPSGDLYVALELCQGETLDATLRRGPVDLARAQQIISQIGAGLLEAQKAGIVHRDLAPKNVLVLPSGDVKLINFAVAVPVSDKLSGVAEYASPEQGQGRPVDQRSNTYSLACILYHLLTGEPPFQGPDPATVFALHGSSPALAPSQRRAAAGLGPDADAAILKALDKNSSRRHLTLRLFLTEVEGLKVAAAATGPAKEVGFAKTMLFAGGSQDVQAMVQKALAEKEAAKSAAAAAGAPAAGAAPAAAPAAVTAAAAGVAETIAPESPAAASAVVAAASAQARLTPPPVTPSPAAAEVDPVEAARKKAAAAPAAAAPAPGGGKGAAFRETLWFKKGDVEQMVAEAKAKGKIGAEGEPELPAEDVRPIEDRYRDDGSLTIEDRKNFSLRTGGTAANMPVVKPVLAGEKMSAADVMSELGGGKKTGMYVAIAAAVVLIIGAVLFAMNRGGDGGGEGKKPAAAAAAEPETVAAPPAPPPPVQAATADGEETQAQAAAPVAAQSPPKKKAPAKKAAAPAKKKK